MTRESWAESVARRYAESVAAGLHDDACEYDLDGFYLCHCAKRRREAKGITEPIGELLFQDPICPGCDEEVASDGDGGFTCERCHSHFYGSGEWSHFYDDFGDDLAGQRDKWRAARAAKRQAAARSEAPATTGSAS